MAAAEFQFEKHKGNQKDKESANSAAAILSNSRLLGRKFSCFQLGWKLTLEHSTDAIRPMLYRKFRFLWTVFVIEGQLVVGPLKRRVFSGSGGGHFQNGRPKVQNVFSFPSWRRPFSKWPPPEAENNRLFRGPTLRWPSITKMVHRNRNFLYSIGRIRSTECGGVSFQPS